MTEQYISKNNENDDANSQNGVREEDTPTESTDTYSPTGAVSGR